jgi:hypothetical protein
VSASTMELKQSSYSTGFFGCLEGLHDWDQLDEKLYHVYQQNAIQRAHLILLISLLLL